MKKLIIVVGCCLSILIIAGVFYYCFGHHNCIGSRSYLLEKEIRDLLFLETHESIDYANAVCRYKYLLQRIRFDNRKANYSERYTKALKRTMIKAHVSEVFDNYSFSSNADDLAEGWALLHQPEYEALEEYRFLSFYWNGKLIDQQWINSSLGVSNQRSQNTRFPESTYYDESINKDE